MAVVAIAAGVGGGFGSRLFGQHRRHSTGHPGTIAILVLLVFFVGSVAVLVWMLRRLWRGQGVFRAPIAAGLPWRRRRAVASAIRRGAPSKDFTQRAVEIETAERATKYARRASVVFALGLVLELANAIFGNHNAAGRVFFYASGVLFALLLCYQQYFVRRASHYLSALPPESE